MSMTPPVPVESMLAITAESYDRYTCKVHEVECLVTHCDGHQVIAPRGTEADGLISKNGWRDVVRDIRMFPSYDWRVGFSHSGFMKGARGLVDKGLFGFLRKDLPIILTGHSLGGAVSVNAAMMLHSMGFNVVAVIVFGAPRTLKKGSAKRFLATGIQIFEYSNAGDPVPDVPRRFWGYRHAREIMTPREARGYSIKNNHSLPWYQEAFKDR